MASSIKKIGMRVLVTGGSGFIGSHLIEELLAHGATVSSLDIREPQRRERAVQYLTCDVTHYEELQKALQEVQPEAIVHLAAIPSVQKSVQNPLATMHTNVTGTFTLLEAARVSGVGRVVFASSGAVFGKTGQAYSGRLLDETAPLEPLNPYGLSKKMGEEMMALWTGKDIWKGVDTVSLRFFNIFGPRQRRDAAYATCVERFLYQWEKREPFTIVPDGKQRRDMVFVKDVVRAIRLAVERPASLEGVVINIGSGNNYSILEIADTIGGSEHPRIFIDARPGEVRETKADIQKAKKMLGWEPTISFSEGIGILKKEMKHHGSAK